MTERKQAVVLGASGSHFAMMKEAGENHVGMWKEPQANGVRTLMGLKVHFPLDSSIYFPNCLN
jgi:hypothetical protein